MYFLFLLGAFCAMGSSIGTLHNTGTTGSGTVDPYWTVNGQSAYVTDTGGFPFPIWEVDSPTVGWISTMPNYFADHHTNALGSYIYATTFDLTGFNPATASIVFSYAVDNLVDDVLLNGVSIAYPFPTNDHFFGVEAPVNLINRGFLQGVNRLEFQTRNTTGDPLLNPNGLRVAFVSSADTTVSNPEPASLILMGAGLLGLIAGARRRGLLSR